MKCLMSCMGFILLYLGTPLKVTEPRPPIDPRELYDFTVEHHAFLRSYFGCSAEAMVLDETTCSPGRSTFNYAKYKKAAKLAAKIYVTK